MVSKEKRIVYCAVCNPKNENGIRANPPILFLIVDGNADLLRQGFTLAHIILRLEASLAPPFAIGSTVQVDKVDSSRHGQQGQVVEVVAHYGIRWHGIIFADSLTREYKREWLIPIPEATPPNNSNSKKARKKQ